MKKSAIALALVLAASPASAQFGRIGDLARKADKAVKTLDSINITAQEERQIGLEVSEKIVQEFGVYQDPNVTKYVSLVGTVLAQASPRPDLLWEFVVLDTEGVNAFAAPGGYVHITKGLLGLMKNEAELAGVLAHEIVHVTEKHTINAIVKGNMVSVTSDEVSSSGGMTKSLLSKVAEATYKNIIDNKFSRDDEKQSDAKGVEIANKVGYAPTGLVSALQKLVDRNAGSQEKNGLFASHPDMKDRISTLTKLIGSRKLAATALVADRYQAHITFDAKSAADLALVPAGTRGLSGGEAPKADTTAKTEPAKTEPAKKEEPAKSGGLFGRLTGGSQKQQTQTVASAGARGVDRDRDAVGGLNKSRVRVNIGANDVAEFKKGIA
jgi:predicted Zn-dependent protease